MATSSSQNVEFISISVACLNQLKSVHNQVKVSGPDAIALFGHITNNRLTVLGCAKCSTSDQVTGLKQKLPGGIGICGISCSTSRKEDFDPTNLSSHYNLILGKLMSNRSYRQTVQTLIRQLLQELSDLGLHSLQKGVNMRLYESEIIHHEPVVVCCHSDSQEVSVSRVCTVSPSAAISDVTYQTTAEKFLQNCLIARASCYIPFTFTLAAKGSWQASVHNEMESLCTDVSSSSTTFHLRSSSVLLSTGWSNGILEQATCRDLTTYIDSPEGVGRKRKSDKTQKTLMFDVYTDLSGAGTLERTPSCAPVINYNTEKVRVVSVQLPVDVVAIVDAEAYTHDLAEILCDTICRQLAAMEKCICQHSKGEKFVTPAPYHFNPLGTEMLYTLVYPHGYTDSQLESHRRELHQSLCLGMDRPLFRLANRYVFPEEHESSGYLINVHESVGPSKVSGGTQYLVKGHYTYHHYMQDRFDDNKWGCAYRSLQTLVSWFRLQGYSDKPIPDHRTVQQTLVDIGDKEPNFVGTKKWIGSMEVSFVLDTILGVTSKILSVSAGSELASKGRELAAHFMTQGTPIMIGGGVLAHTILGVNYDEVTGDINFLILDPHYTGAEDLKVITEKGWCGWKGPEFWDQHAHYNMCLPQRPVVI